MRRAWIAVVVAACGAPAVPPPVQPQPGVPRLAAPPLIDADVRGAAYLTAVALSLQPAWHQFLEDCRLRLGAHHALNDLALAAVAELEVDARGRVVDVRIATSGNADFDRAARQVVADASPLPPPPRELWSDDDHVHLVWTFARDRRQAGPATAQIVAVELPLRGVVDRLIGERDLSRAARRILRAKPAADRDLATRRLMVALLRDALTVSDGAMRRAAVDAIGRARVTELADDVRQLLTATSDVELRLAAIDTVVALRDSRAAAGLVDQLAADLRDRPRVALAAARALVALDRANDVEPALAAALAAGPPPPGAIQALAAAPVAAYTEPLADWFRAGSPRQRAAVCSALAGYHGDVAWPLLVRGLADRDASVRASCVAAAGAQRIAPTQRAGLTAQRTALARLRELARDRDSTVRAHVIAALVQLDPAHVPDAATDAAADVRAAYASAIGTLLARDGVAPARDAAVQLRALADDRDPDVRAAAWAGLAAGPADPERRALATRAAADAAAQVRRAAIPALDDDDVLLRLARHDDDAEVRTAALVEYAGRRGRAASTAALLARVAEAPPGSSERVRTALAWLLAR